MIPIQLSADNQDPQSDVRRIMDAAQGKTLILDAAPTSTNNSVPEGEVGYFSGKLYTTIGGVLKEWAVSNTA